MNRSLILFACGLWASVSRGTEPLMVSPASNSVIAIQLGEATRVQVQVTIDDASMQDYWQSIFADIFRDADQNGNQTIDENELRWVPSVRAFRLSLGNGFVPPVAALTSIQPITGNDTVSCNQAALAAYYLKHGIGKPQVGYGHLPHTQALAAALIAQLDDDRDQVISSKELQLADKRLRKLDTNDDELIAATELVPSISYPGAAGTHALSETETQKDSSASASSSTIEWCISVSDAIFDAAHVLVQSVSNPVELWTVTGPLPQRIIDLEAELPNSVQPSSAEEKSDDTNRGSREVNFNWLIASIDHDQDGVASQDEIQRWLAVQQRINHGQLLITILTGGGLFELLDADHDGGLSQQELRSGWQRLEAEGYTTADKVSLDRIRPITLLIASQGLPDSIAKRQPIPFEWFRKMDHNEDGDVSRREFTGPREAFERLDQDHDDLLSLVEAAAQ